MTKPRGMTPPWSKNGWYGDEVRRSRDPAITEIIRNAGRGRVAASGFERGRPGLDVSPASHSPYILIFWCTVFVAFGFFLFVQLSETAWLAWVVAGIFWLGALIGFASAMRQIPSWHRARRDVKEYLRHHEGSFPQELKWYA